MAVGPSLTRKYADDVADIVKNGQTLPRTLLRNGKRSAAGYTSPRERQSSTTSVPNNLAAPPVLSPAQPVIPTVTGNDHLSGCSHDCASFVNDISRLKKRGS